jgi:hypothetical protein
MTWAHREADANCIKWLLSHQYADEFADAPTQHAVSITAMTNDATVQTIAARVEAYERKRVACARGDRSGSARGQRRVAKRREDPHGGGWKVMTAPRPENGTQHSYARATPPTVLEEVKAAPGSAGV